MSGTTFALEPPYPLYSPQPRGGNLPPPSALGPPDVRASQMNPSYDVYAASAGRPFAGLEGAEMRTADEGITDYPNELDYMALADDSYGNGMFDPPGTHGNIHPDEGVFADHQSIPGYIERDQFYTPSEVHDATTGGSVMYVPAGAVAIDDAQRRAFEDRLMWEIPPGVNPYRMGHPSRVSTVTPQQASYGVGASDPTSVSRLFVYAGLAGLAAGVVLAMAMPKKG